jgi:hypothetical protein
MRRLSIFGLVLALALGLLAAPASARGNGGEDLATVNVVHGIPGDSLGFDRPLPVDVCLADGTPLITDLTFAEVEVLEVPAGTYDLEVRLDAPADCDGATVLAAPGVAVGSGVSYSVVANLTSDGAPGFGDVLGLPIGLSVFVDDLSRAGLLKGRVNVRHTAEAPAVDIWVKARWGGFDPAFIGLTGANGGGVQEGSADLWLGKYSAGIAVSPSASPADIAIEAPFKIKPGQGLNVYAVGSLEDGNFTLVTQYQKLERPLAWGRR